ncbi:MAG: FAD:protein FMN transferase [Bauldia sp.]|nr:FAD:protein FMN transferase [Bauldia sp.]
MTIADVTPAPRRSGFSRRQALKIVAATAAIPVAVTGWRLLGPAATFHTWEGEVLGAVSSLTLYHSNAAYAQRTIDRMIAEVRRLETVFSLFRPTSELSQLNTQGRIAGASRDLVTVMEAARSASDLTGGAFDTTVQPLWNVYSSHFAVPGADPAGPSPAAIDAARRLVGYRNIDIGSRSVAFAVPGMMATLNGIAQGYITDAIADILRNEGFTHVVVELGETRVVGEHPDGRPWRVGLRDQAGETNRMMDLSDGSVALHGGYGTVFDPEGRNHHIFDPATGRSADRYTDVVILSPRAIVADAIGVGLYVAGEEGAAAVVAAYPGTSAVFTRRDGSRVTIG